MLQKSYKTAECRSKCSKKCVYWFTRARICAQANLRRQLRAANTPRLQIVWIKRFWLKKSERKEFEVEWTQVTRIGIQQFAPSVASDSNLFESARDQNVWSFSTAWPVSLRGRLLFWSFADHQLHRCCGPMISTIIRHFNRVHLIVLNVWTRPSLLIESSRFCK